jgi:hypothetical protein
MHLSRSYRRVLGGFGDLGVFLKVFRGSYRDAYPHDGIDGVSRRGGCGSDNCKLDLPEALSCFRHGGAEESEGHSI